MSEPLVPKDSHDAEHGHKMRRIFRRKRLQVAFTTSAISKVLGLMLQVVVVPATVHLLGVERFGLYTMLISGLVWIDLARAGIGPGLTRMLAVAWNDDNEPTQRALFSSALFLLSAACILLVCAGVVVALFSGDSAIQHALGPEAGKYVVEIHGTLLIIAIFLLCQIITSPAESARSAYQEEYINNLSGGISSLLAILALAVLGARLDTIPAFAAAMLGSLVIAKLMNFGLLLRVKPTLRPRFRSVRLSLVRGLLHGSLAFWLVQLGTTMMHAISTAQLGSMTSPTSLASYAVLFRLLQLLSTFALMISTPLWPAITDAVVRQDHEWILGARRKLLLSVMGFAVVASIIIAVFGERLISFWSGEPLEAERLLCIVMGIYFSVWMWNHCHTVLLYGLGRLWPVGLTVVAEGSAVLLLGAILVPRFGNLGMALSLSIAGTCISAWILPMFCRQSIGPRLEHKGAAHP